MKINKKIITLALCTMLSMSLIGCSNTKEVTSTEDTSKKETVIKKDIPEGLSEELGNGTIIVSTAGGTSEDGNIPVVFAEEDLVLEQIGLDAEDFDGSKLSYIYIDGMNNTKEQLGEMTQTTLTLDGDALNKGTHKVEVVQYDNDEATGKAITYKTASYEIKTK
ncbi:hypothetical protein [Romboutsia sp.]|uniref:hypothetical protein n=1 Tax=Romboutsia sp. TaxID=1965302 RepID=UPI002C388559|nr:hypothetical protein [Romboutsia sp.]HSQ88697.1 hypothetical protein [Romboutsia sp.]